MNARKLITGLALILVFLAGCGAPRPTPTIPPPPQGPCGDNVCDDAERTNPSLCPQDCASTASPSSTIQPTGQASLFKFIQTFQVTPDSNFLTGGFARINYVPATDRFVVTFGGVLAGPPAGCGEKGYSYKEYSLDMQETGKSGTFSCDPFDSGSVMVDNTYYFAAMANKSGQEGWRLLKIDATNWQILVDTFLPLDVQKRTNADPMVAYVNERLYVSAGYYESGAPPPMTEGAATHLQIFSPDLQHLDEKILADTPQFTGSSLTYLDGIYNFVTANAFAGDVAVIKYDQNWKYLGVKTLIKQAHWSTGLAYDGQRFYVAYLEPAKEAVPASFRFT